MYFGNYKQLTSIKFFSIILGVLFLKYFWSQVSSLKGHFAAYTEQIRSIWIQFENAESFSSIESRKCRNQAAYLIAHALAEGGESIMPMNCKKIRYGIKTLLVVYSN